MSKQIQIRNDLYERMKKAKIIIDERGKVAKLNICESVLRADRRYSQKASFSDVLDWLFSESEYL